MNQRLNPIALISALAILALAFAAQCFGSNLDTSGWRASYDSPRRAVASAYMTEAALQPHPSVCRIKADYGNHLNIGSGVYVGQGYVLTCYHTFADGQANVSVSFPSTSQYQATGWIPNCQVVATDPVWDLAAVKVPSNLRVPAVPLAKTVTLGEVLTIAGYGSTCQYRTSSGRAVQYLDAAGGATGGEMVDIRCSVRSGDSGGPVFNSRGEVAGVLWGGGRSMTAATYGPRLTNFLQQCGWNLFGLGGGNGTDDRQIWPSQGGSAGCGNGQCGVPMTPVQPGAVAGSPYITVPGQPEVIMPSMPGAGIIPQPPEDNAGPDQLDALTDQLAALQGQQDAISGQLSTLGTPDAGLTTQLQTVQGQIAEVQRQIQTTAAVTPGQLDAAVTEIKDQAERGTNKLWTLLTWGGAGALALMTGNWISVIVLAAKQAASNVSKEVREFRESGGKDKPWWLDLAAKTPTTIDDAVLGFMTNLAARNQPTLDRMTTKAGDWLEGLMTRASEKATKAANQEQSQGLAGMLMSALGATPPQQPAGDVTK